MESITKVIQSIPKDVNPYDYLSKFLVTIVLPKTGRVLSVNLAVNSGVFGLALLFAVAALVGKIRAGETWLLKRKDTSVGSLWLPNSTYLWSIFSIGYIATAEVDIWTVLLTQEQRLDPRVAQYSFSYKWIFLFAALWVETHGMASSAFLFSYLRSSQGRLQIPAWCFNAFFVFGYLFCSMPALILGFLCPIRFGRGWTELLVLRDDFDAQARLWDGKSALNIQLKWFTQVETILKHLAEYARLSELTYTILLANLVFITITFLIAAAFYTQILRKQINRDYDALGKMYSADQGKKEGHVTELRTTFRLLMAKAMCIGAAAIAYVGLGAGPVSDFQSFFLDGSKYSVAVAGQFYVYSIFASPVLVTLAYRVWKEDVAHLTRRRSSHENDVRTALGLPFSFADQINVNSETVVEVDESDERALGYQNRYEMRDAFGRKEIKDIDDADEKSFVGLPL